MKQLNVPQSGSQAATTASRNRYGQYLRSRATPVNPNSTAQGTARGRLAAAAAAWRELTDAQRSGWTGLGALMQRTDSLGQRYTLTGFQAYVSVNSIRALCGQTAVADAPALDTPEALTSMTLTAADDSITLAYTATPLPAATYLLVECSPQRSAGRSFEGDFRKVHLSAAAAASPADLLAAYTAKFGAPVAGNRLFARARAVRNGFASGPVVTSAVIEPGA